MLVDIDRESQAEFRTGSGTVGTDVVRLGAAIAQQTVTVTATGGHFKLALDGVETADIAYDAAAAVVQAALEAVVGAGNVAVSGDAGGPWTVKADGSLRWQLVSALVATDVDLEGEGHAVAVAVVEPGHAVGRELKKYVMLRANGANGNVIMVGHSAAAVGDGFILSAGQQSPPIYVDNLNKVYLVGGAGGQGYSWIAC
jgi:hypothetical protein